MVTDFKISLEDVHISKSFEPGSLQQCSKHLPSLTRMCEEHFTIPPNFQDLIQLNEFKIIRSSYITERYGIFLNDEGNLSIYTELMESSFNVYPIPAKYEIEIDGNDCKSFQQMRHIAWRWASQLQDPCGKLSNIVRFQFPLNDNQLGKTL
jgi:hypothetical protein